MPSWSQHIDQWQRQREQAEGEDPDGNDMRQLDRMREWMEDARTVAVRDLHNDYLTKLFEVVLGRLASPECESYWVLRDRVAASLRAAMARGTVEEWELEYIDGKIGTVP